MAEGPKWITAAEAVSDDPLQIATITLTDAQIKTGEAIEIVPPTEIFDYDILPTRLPVLVSAIGMLNCEAAAYDDATSFSIGYGQDGTKDISVTSSSTFAVNNEKRLAICAFNYPNSGIVAVGDLGSNGIVVQCSGATGGDPSNTLKLTVYYSLVDIS